MRTTSVPYGLSPYNWDSKYKWECTWYCFYRSVEAGLPVPEWNDRVTETGTFNNANTWLKNYRDPWVPKGKDYKPVANDIVVFDGQYGHVAFVEKVEGNVALLSQYMNGKEDSFSTKSWEIGTSYTGPLLGYLHCPVEAVEPVIRDNTKDQIHTTDGTLRIRTKPSLASDVVGHVRADSYYDVLSAKQNDGYTWYELAKDRWCANITTEFLPKGDDFVDEIRKWADTMIDKARRDEQTIIELKSNMRNIEEIAKKWNI